MEKTLNLPKLRVTLVRNIDANKGNKKCEKIMSVVHSEYIVAWLWVSGHVTKNLGKNWTLKVLTCYSYMFVFIENLSTTFLISLSGGKQEWHDLISGVVRQIKLKINVCHIERDRSNGYLNFGSMTEIWAKGLRLLSISICVLLKLQLSIKLYWKTYWERKKKKPESINFRETLSHSPRIYSHFYVIANFIFDTTNRMHPFFQDISFKIFSYKSLF